MQKQNNQPLAYNLAINKRMVAVCKPLFENLGLTHFIYIQLLENGRLYLCNDIHWIERYLENEFFKDLKHEQQAIILQSKPRYAFWNAYKSDNVFSSIYDFGVWNGLIVYQGNEIFSFGAKKENTEIFNLYINNLRLIEHFILYFKNKMSDIICPTYYKDSIIVSNHRKLIIPSEQPEEKYHTFMNQTALTKYLWNNNPNVSLSKKQAKCLFYLSNGRSAKEVGNLLQVSSRTVEKYIEIMKHKLDCGSTSKLIDLFLNSSIKHALDLY